MKIRALFTLLFIMTLYGCLQKDYDYQYDHFVPELVINAELSPQEGVVVKVSRSTSPTTRELPVEALYVQDADVLLIENGQIEYPLEFEVENRYHTSNDFSPKPSAGYTIQVSHPELGTVFSSEVFLPAVPQVREHEFVKNAELSINGLNTYTMNLLLEDEANVANYYKITVRTPFTEYQRSTNAEKVIENEKVNNICELFYFLGREIYFNDICFEGEQITIPLWMQPIPLVLSAREQIDPEKVVIRLSAITTDAYLYGQSLNTPEEFALAFADPIPLYSNMSNGNGVFSASNYLEYELPLE